MTDEYTSGIPADPGWPDDIDAAEPAGRTPPQDLAAEQAVLGAMMLNRDVIGEVTGLLEARDFYRPVNGQVFDAILALDARGEPADALTVAAELGRRGWLARVGGPAYLADLVGSVVVAANGAYHARLVAGKAVLRRLGEAATKVLQDAYRGQGDPQVLVDEAQQAMFEVGRSAPESAVPLGRLIDPALDDLDAIRAGGGVDGVPTGFKDLDKLTNGLHPGQMIIVAARPGMGKSTLGLDFARHAAIRHDMTTAFFSLEMTNEELTMRLLAAEASVSLHNMRTGVTSEAERKRIHDAAGLVYPAPLYFHDRASVTMAQIRSTCRHLKQAKDLRLVVIDYLQLMSTPGRRAESRQVEVAEYSRQVKLLAKDLDVPVVAISQLNRAPESRGSDRDSAGTPKGRPMLSDLRESGSLEQDADVVILLYREDAYKEKSDRTGEADLIVAKHRNGPTGNIAVAFQGHYSRFVDMAK